MVESLVEVSRGSPALPGFLQARIRSVSADPSERNELEEIRHLCSQAIRVTRAQIIPENVLLADALRPDRTGASFLEALPIEACNHECPWCFTAARRSAEVPLDGCFGFQLREFVLRGGLATLFSGGGEPLIYRPLSIREEEFENETVCQWLIRHGVVPAIITNGTLLRRFVEANHGWLQQMAFVRVSLDAFTARQHELRHKTTTREFESILEGIRLLLQIRGMSATPAVGISFVVDVQSGVNANEEALQGIGRLASSLGVDFVQLKHLHTENASQADSSMRWLAKKAEVISCSGGPEWWIHRYRAAEPKNLCHVPIEAQVLRSDGRRSPCCHLQTLPLPWTGSFTVSGCRSSVCRYQSMNGVLLQIKESREQYFRALTRLKASLVEHGFHPFRLFPSAPDLAFRVNE